LPIQETPVVDSIGGPNPIVGFRRKDLLDSLRTVLRGRIAPEAHHAEACATSPASPSRLPAGRGELTRPKEPAFTDTAWTEQRLYNGCSASTWRRHRTRRVARRQRTVELDRARARRALAGH